MAIEVVFLQRAARKVRAMSFSWEKDIYASPDMTIIGEHITFGGVTELAYQQEADSIIWAVRSDGTLLGLTYERDQQVFAWHRHNLGGSGNVESVAVIPGTNRDELWCVVERTIDSSTVRYVEQFQLGMDIDET